MSVAGSYFSLRDDNSNNGNNNFQDGRFNLWKAALGTYYFINLGDLKYKQKETKAERVYSMIEPIGLLFDLYAGYGEGVVENNYNTGSQSLLDHQQYFIQGGFHFVCSFIDVGISVRKSTLNYYNGRILGQIENINLIDIEELLEGNRYSPTEISFKVAGGWKYGKIFVHYNMAPNLNPRLLSDGPNGSVGFQLHLNEVIQGIKKLK